MNKEEFNTQMLELLEKVDPLLGGYDVYIIISAMATILDKCLSYLPVSDREEIIEGVHDELYFYHVDKGANTNVEIFKASMPKLH